MEDPTMLDIEESKPAAASEPAAGTEAAKQAPQGRPDPVEKNGVWITRAAKSTFKDKEQTIQVRISVPHC